MKKEMSARGGAESAFRAQSRREDLEQDFEARLNHSMRRFEPVRAALEDLSKEREVVGREYLPLYD
jgi:hypothetical protein